MSHPRRLSLRDVRTVFRMIGEILELGADTKVWRPHMVKRLRKLFGVEIVVSSEVHARTTRTPGKLRIIDIGWSCDSEGNLWDIHSERDDETLEAWRLAAGQFPSDAATEDADAVEVPVRPMQHVYGGGAVGRFRVCAPPTKAEGSIGAARGGGVGDF